MAKMTLEIQHNDVNVTTETLLTCGRTYLKEQKYVLSHFDIEFYFVPNTMSLYYKLTSNKDKKVITGVIPNDYLVNCN